jgi:hypothetical protein
MKMSKLMLGSALLAVGLTAGAQAQQYLPQQVQYQAAPYQAPPQRPPSWSYDPYTSGLGPCPQKDHKDLTSCSQLMPPTYGQPSYWSR